MIFNNMKISKNGYDKLSLLNKDDADSLSEEIINIVHDKIYRKFVWIDEQESDHRLFGVENILASVDKLKRELVKSMKLIYRSDIDATFLCQHVVAKKYSEGSGGGFHRDSIKNQYKAFLYLSDSTEENGCLQIVRNSHNLKSKISDMIAQKKIRFDIRKPHVDEKYLSSIVAQKGEVLCCNTSSIHRGKPGLISDRINLTLYAYKKGDMPNHIKDLIYSS